MDIETTVDIDEYQVLDNMKTEDIVEYLKERRKCQDVEDTVSLIRGMDPMDVLTAAAYHLLPRNICDRQSVVEAIQEYISRV